RLLDYVPTAMAVSPDGKSLVVCGFNRSVTILNMETHERSEQEIPLIGGAGSLAFSPDGKTFLTVRNDEVVQLWHWPTCRAVGNAFRGGEHMSDIVVTPDGKLLIRGLLENNIIPSVYEWRFPNTA